MQWSADPPWGSRNRQRGYPKAWPTILPTNAVLVKAPNRALTSTKSGPSNPKNKKICTLWDCCDPYFATKTFSESKCCHNQGQCSEKVEWGFSHGWLLAWWKIDHAEKKALNIATLTWNWVSKITNIVLQISVPLLLASNISIIWKGSTRPYFLP